MKSNKPRIKNFEKGTITKSQEFSHILKNGSIFRSKWFVLASVPGETDKVGFTTPKGLMAVERNKLKRRLRELWRTCQPEKNLHRHLILLIKKSALSDPFAAVKKDFTLLMNKYYNAV